MLLIRKIMMGGGDFDEYTVTVTPTEVVTNIVVGTATKVTVNENPNVTITAPAGLSFGTPADVAKGSAFTLQFTLSDGYHTPQVKVNGTYNPAIAASESNGTYTLTLPNVSDDKTISISALPPTVLLAKEDTYVRGLGYNTTNYALDAVISVQNSDGLNWVRRAYISFEPSDYLRNNVYNRAELKLTYLAREKDNNVNKIGVFTVTNNVAVNSMTWNANSEYSVQTTSSDNKQHYLPSGVQISEWVGVNYSKSTLTDGPAILLGDTVLKQLPNAAIRFQLAATLEGGTDGNINFASLENTDDLYYAPRLVFSQVPSDVTISYNGAVKNLKITRKGDNAEEDVSSSPHTYVALFDTTITITFGVTEGYAAQLTLDGVRRDDLLKPNGSDNYSLTLSNILKDKKVEINAIEPVNFTVTEATSGSVTITEPAHFEIDVPEKVARDEPFTLKFRLNEGYDFASVQVGAETFDNLTPNGDVYTLEIERAACDTTITINVSLHQLSVDFTSEKDEHVVWVEGPAASVDYFGTYTLKFTLSDGYHTPQVKIDGIYNPAVTASESNGTYTLTLSNVTGDNKTISILALPPTELLAKEDTYVNGNSSTTENSYGDAVSLLVQGSYSTNWTRRAYMSFEPSEYLKNNVYNKAELKLRYLSREPGGKSHKVGVFTVANDVAVNSMTWNTNQEQLAVKGDTISDWVIIDYDQSTPQDVPGILLGDTVLKQLSNDLIRLQVAADGIAPASEGNLYFASLENATDLYYAPRLVFSQVPSNVTISYNEGAVNNLKITRKGDNAEESASSSPHTYVALFDTTITITFDVTEGYAAHLTLDGVRRDALLVPNGNNQYSLTLPNILTPKTVILNAIDPVALTVTETASGSVTITEPSYLQINVAEKVEKNGPFTLKFKVNEGYAFRNVQVGAKTFSDDDLTPEGGVYTLTINDVASNTDIIINAPLIIYHTITLNIPLKDVAVTTVLPADNKFKVENDSTFTLSVILKSGYGFTSALWNTEDITATNVSKPMVTYWTVKIPNVTADATLTLAIDTVLRTITVNEQAGVTNVSAPTSVKNFTEAKITFELAAGYHLPQAWVGAGYRTVTGDGSPYTLSIPNVMANQTVTLWAYPDTVAPATEDTYIASGSSTASINYAKGDTLVVEQTAATGSYLRRAYLKFDVPDNIISGGYNYAALQLYVKEVEKSGKTNPNRIEVRTTPADVSFPAVTWSNSGNMELEPNGVSLAQSEDIPLTAADTLIALDISDYYLDAADPTTFLLQVAGVYDDNHSDGYVKLYSREIVGKDAAKSGYIPVLAFGKRPSSVTVQTADGNVTALNLVSPEAQSGAKSYTAAVECDSSLTFTVTVADKHYPYVTVNGALFAGSITPTGVPDEYSITVEHIKRSASVEVTAIVPVNVTLHAPKGGVQVLSPAGFPVGDAGAKVPKDQPFELKLKVREGFRFDSAKVVGIANAADSVKLTPVISGDTVTLTLDNAGADTIIVLFTDTLKRSVTVATQGEAGAFENLSFPDEVTHFSTAKITFSLAAGYHLPLAWVNGGYLPVTGEGNSYTLSISSVRADRSVTLWAYPDTVVPVTEDTYISGVNPGISYAKDTLIAVQRSDYQFPNFMNRAYLQFNIPNSIKSGGYNYAALQLYVKQADKSKGTPNRVEVWTATMPVDVNLSTLTWSNSNNTVQAPQGGTLLAQSGSIPVATTDTPLALDVSDYFLDNAAPTTLLQVAGVSGYSDGYLYFYSKENLAAQGAPRPEYIPVLVFGKRPSRVAVTVGDSVTLVAGEPVKDVLSGEDYTLRFTASSYLPSVTLTPAKPYTLTADASEWTLTIPNVMRPVAASIELRRIVEITTGANVTVSNAKLTDTVGLKAPHVTGFTLTAGYIPAVTRNGNVISVPYSSTNSYSVTSTEVVPKTVVDVAAVKPKLNIALGAGMDNAFTVEGGVGEREVSASSYTLNFTLADSYANPTAQMGGQELTPQETSTPASYALTINVTRSATLTLTAAVERRVSVAAGEHFTVTSPSKKPNADYYAAGENSAWVMTFTLDAGYELAGAYVGQTPVTPVLSGSTYTLTIDNVTGDTTVTISTRLLRFRIAIDAGEDVAILPSSFNTAEPNVDSVDYGADYVLTFTVSENHLPQATVNSAPYPLDEPTPDGVYTVSISSVTEDKSITLATQLQPPPVEVKVEVEVAVEGTGIAILSPAGAGERIDSVDYGAGYVLTFTVSEKHLPQVTVNDAPYPLGEPTDGVYTVSIGSVTEKTTIILATQPPHTVTVQADANILGLAPAGTLHTVAHGDTLTLTFTVTAGYTVTVTPESLSSGLSREGDSYTLILPNITGDAAVGIAATPPAATGVASNEQNDHVIATRYYTLQGQEIREPAIIGIYIVKKIFASGKTTATKRLFYKIK